MSSPGQPTTPAADRSANPRGERLETPSLILLLLGILFLVASGFLWRQWLQVRSRESVLEVRTLTLRTPIDGILSDLVVSAGSPIQMAQPLFKVQNDRIPRPRVGDLRLQLTAASARLELLKHKLERSERLVAEARGELGLQSRLQVARQQQDLQSLLRQRQKAADELAFMQRDQTRKRQLFTVGAMSYDLVDRAETSARQAAEEVRSLDNRINAQRKILEAAKSNLTLIATRGGADPESRWRDDQQTLFQIRDDYQAQRQQLESLKEQLRTAEQEHRFFTEAVVRSPVNGVVGRVDAFGGSSVQRQTAVMQILDCSQRWINTYVREPDLRRLRIGQRAKITLHGTSTTLTGSITLIRSGIGRAASGSDAPPLLPINIYREAQVKVAIEQKKTLREDPKHLCYSGYTGTVTFLSQNQGDQSR